MGYAAPMDQDLTTVPLGGLDINLPVAALYRDLDFADE
jgi:hypothetical protein